jgi:glycosyltransferase involved in cell wall biosynthesis
MTEPTPLFPRITLITPSFNQADFLEETINSVLDQAYPNLQYGIIDGGSTDDSYKIIERYRDRLDFAVIEPDRGQTDAINKGLAKADGEIVGWLCSDDTLLPGALEKIGGHFAMHPRDDWIAGACQVINSNGIVTETVSPYGNFTIPGVLFRDDEQPFNLPQPGVFWRRSLHDLLGLLDESLHYCMDFEFWLRLIESGRRPTLINTALATYRLHDASKSCAQPIGFTREHIRVEAGYARSLTLPQRLRFQRRLGYMQRTCAIHDSGGQVWPEVLRRPWWLLSHQVRQAILHSDRKAA